MANNEKLPPNSPKNKDDKLEEKNKTITTNNNKPKHKNNVSNKTNSIIPIINLILLVSLVFILVFSQSYNNNQFKSKPVDNYNKQTKNNIEPLDDNIVSASERYGNKKISINKSSHNQNIGLLIREIQFLKDKTIIQIQLENHNTEPIHVLGTQNSSLIDQTGREYNINPYQSDDRLNGNISPNGKEIGILVFEPVNKKAEELKFRVQGIGNFPHIKWYNSVKFSLE